MKKLQKGFTLIELMIVVAIIAILAAVAAPKFGQQVKKAKDAKALAIVGNWRSGSNLYYSDKSEYATTVGAIEEFLDKTSVGAPTSKTDTTIVLTVGTNTIAAGSGTDSKSITATYTPADGQFAIGSGYDTLKEDWSKK